MKRPKSFTVVIAGAGQARARAVILATGASYLRLGIPALEDLTGCLVSMSWPMKSRR